MLKEKGIIQFIPMVLLLAGLIGGLVLLQKTQVLSSHAGGGPITIQDSQGNTLPTKNNIPYTSSPSFKVVLYSTLGPPQSSSSSAKLNSPISSIKSLINKVIPGKKPTIQGGGGYNQIVAVQPGWNSFGQTVDISTGSAVLASNLIDYLNQWFPYSPGQTKPGIQGGGPTPVNSHSFIRVSKYNPDNDNFITYTAGVNTATNLRNNFQVNSGEGYLVYSKQPGNTLLGGNQFPPQTSISLHSGGNFISFTAVSDSINTAEKLAQSIKSQGGKVAAIIIWDQGAWSVHLAGQNDTNSNMPIQSGVGYSIRMDNDITYQVPSVSPTPIPSTPYTVSYQIAENPNDSNTNSSFPYTVEPTIINYTLTNSTPGQHFVWVRFKDSNGKTDERSAEIDLVSPTTPSPTPTPNWSLFKQSMLLDGYGACAIGSAANFQISPTFANATPQLTIEGWFKAYSTDGIRTILSTTSQYITDYRAPSGNPTWTTINPVIKVAIVNGKLTFTYSGSNVAQSATITGNTQIQGGQWYNFAIAINNINQLMVFLNGKSDASPVALLSPTSATVNIPGNIDLGCQETSNITYYGWTTRGNTTYSNYFNGELDDIRSTNYSYYSSYISNSYPTPTTPYGTDSNTFYKTISLWHLDGLVNGYGVPDETNKVNLTSPVGNLKFITSSVHL